MSYLAGLLSGVLLSVAGYGVWRWCTAARKMIKIRTRPFQGGSYVMPVPRVPSIGNGRIRITKAKLR
jgi:hypothetical protein